MTSTFISTGGAKKNSRQFIEECRVEGISHFEISGSIVDTSFINYMSSASSAGCMFRFHNFFSYYGKEFVLNLGSKDKQVFNLSRQHIINALELSNRFESEYYAFHAPFLIDPKITNLGNGFPVSVLYDRQETTKRFVENVNSINNIAKEYGVKLAIENNVFSETDKRKFGTHHPFTYIANDIIVELKNITDEVGLLLDFGHFKVSCNSESVNPKPLLKKIWPRISGYHFSDNNSREDTNGVIPESPWFANLDLNPQLPRTLEVYNLSACELSNQIHRLDIIISGNMPERK